MEGLTHFFCPSRECQFVGFSFVPGKEEENCPSCGTPLQDEQPEPGTEAAKAEARLKIERAQKTLRLSDQPSIDEGSHVQRYYCWNRDCPVVVAATAGRLASHNRTCPVCDREDRRSFLSDRPFGTDKLQDKIQTLSRSEDPNQRSLFREPSQTVPPTGRKVRCPKCGKMKHSGRPCPHCIAEVSRRTWKMRFPDD